jgi:hypothetical protein
MRTSIKHATHFAKCICLIIALMTVTATAFTPEAGKQQWWEQVAYERQGELMLARNPFWGFLDWLKSLEPAPYNPYNSALAGVEG